VSFAEVSISQVPFWRVVATTLTQYNSLINYRFYQFLTIFKKKNQLDKILTSEPLQEILTISDLFDTPSLESEFLSPQPHYYKLKTLELIK